MILFFQQGGKPSELPDAQAHGEGAPVEVPQARTATAPPGVAGISPDLAAVFASLNELHERITKAQSTVSGIAPIKDPGHIAQEGKPKFEKVIDDFLMFSEKYTDEFIAKREEVDAKAKKKEYGDVKYADPKNSSYPIETKEHAKAAWGYINQSGNAAKYSSEDLATVKGRIKAACKKFGIEISE